jgi:DNA polymerase
MKKLTRNLKKGDVIERLNKSALLSLNSRIALCHRCPLCLKRNNTVPGNGDIDSKIMFIGECPGEQEDIQGQPFVGQSGQLFNKAINELGYDRRSFYVTNIVKCRSTHNRAPNEEECLACMPFLREQYRIIKPSMLILLGGTALKYILQRVSIMKDHGTLYKFNNDTYAMPTFHPSFVLYKPEYYAIFKEEIRKSIERDNLDRAITITG